MRTKLPLFGLIVLACALGALGSIATGCNGSNASCIENRDCPRDITNVDDASPADDRSQTAPVDKDVITTPVVDGGGGEDTSTNDADGDVEDVAVDTFDGAVNGCAVASSPKDDACVLQDAIGVFVAPGANNTNAGTAAAPVGSITKALEIARASAKQNIFVCAGTYVESLAVSEGSSIRVHGGLACGPSGDGGGGALAWSWTGALTKLAPTNENTPVLLVDRVAGIASFEDLELQGVSRTVAGTSGIAAFVRSCPDVRFTRVVLRAGNGAQGSIGAAGSFVDNAPSTGNNTSSASGATSVTCTCTSGGSTTGAAGGTGGLGSSNGLNGSPNLDGGAPNDGVGGGSGCSAGHEGTGGKDGLAGVKEDALATFGSVTFAGWAPTSSNPITVASNGSLAQGGGGGGGVGLGAGGGSGGCGGCGGQGGARGANGGSSFALLAYQSTIVLDGCALFAGNGGSGGVGGVGQVGQNGANGGTGACGGGRGGRGGGGGGGSGGTGGLSIAIAYAGTEPTSTSTTLQAALAGQGGAGGSGGAAGNANAGGIGKIGTSATSLSLP